MNRRPFDQFPSFVIQHAIVERLANTREFGQPNFDREQVIVARRGAVAHVAFNHRKNHALFL